MKTYYIYLSRILCAIFLGIIAPALAAAQYSTEAFSLKQASELYDERGYSQNSSISVDGRLVISNSNGNVSYSYPIANAPISGNPLSVTLNYCGSVAFTAFKEYSSGNQGDPYSHWNKFSQNRPAWILGVNGFAIQMLSSNSSFHCDPAKFNGTPRTSCDDKDLVWLADGYDFCNRMENLMTSEESTYGFVDQINILKADGSLLSLINVKKFDPNKPTANRSDLYSGTYVVNGADDKGFAVVDFDSIVWGGYIKQWSDTFERDASARYRFIPRRVKYYPGDGMEYQFVENVIPYGLNAYVGAGLGNPERFGGMNAGPTIFYLDQINSNTGGGLPEFKRTRHYYPRDVVTLNEGNIFDPVFTSIYDSTPGRALITDFGEISIGYGDVGLTIQAYGRTTKVRFAKRACPKPS